MFLPFTPLVSFTNLPSSLFPSQSSEKNSRTCQEVQVVKNVPNEKGTPIEISACVNETEDAATRVNRTIDTLRTDQNKALEFKNSLISLKEKIDGVTNQPDKGFLRYSETKNLYLSNHFKILETVGLRDAGAAKFEKKFDGLDLEFGKKTSKASIISKIDKKLDDQDKYISSLGDMIKFQEGKLSAEQPTTNDADSNTPHETKVDQRDSMGDELSAWPKRKPQDQVVHSLIEKHLNRDNPDLTIREIESLEPILNVRENSGALPPPIPPRTYQNRELPSAPDKNVQAHPAQPVPAKAIEREFEQKTPDDQGVLPSSLVKRSASEAGTSSMPTPIPAPRKINFKHLNRTESNSETSTTGTTGTTGTTENTLKGIRAFWEAQSKLDSV